jgi:hypothetical protein
VAAAFVCVDGAFVGWLSLLVELAGRFVVSDTTLVARAWVGAARSDAGLARVRRFVARGGALVAAGNAFVAEAGAFAPAATGS